jgi:hypothetical protein
MGRILYSKKGSAVFIPALVLPPPFSWGRVAELNCHLNAFDRLRVNSGGAALTILKIKISFPLYERDRNDIFVKALVRCGATSGGRRLS